ncbi:hypothetical protein D9M70_302430 [compost metagenome]
MQLPVRLHFEHGIQYSAEVFLGQDVFGNAWKCDAEVAAQFLPEREVGQDVFARVLHLIVERGRPRVELAFFQAYRQQHQRRKPCAVLAGYRLVPFEETECEVEDVGAGLFQ